MKNSTRYLILALVFSFGFQSFASAKKLEVKTEQELKKKSEKTKDEFISSEALKGIKKSLKKEKKQIKKSAKALRKNKQRG